MSKDVYKIQAFMVSNNQRRAKTPRTAIHHALTLASQTPASLFFVDDGEGDEVAVAVPVEVDVLTRT